MNSVFSRTVFHGHECGQDENLWMNKHNHPGMLWTMVLSEVLWALLDCRAVPAPPSEQDVSHHSCSISKTSQILMFTKLKGPLPKSDNGAWLVIFSHYTLDISTLKEWVLGQFPFSHSSQIRCAALTFDVGSHKELRVTASSESPGNTTGKEHWLPGECLLLILQKY